MLLSDISNAVKIDIGDEGNTYIKEGHIVSWINEAIRDIFRKTSLGRSQMETFNLPVGTNVWTPTHEVLEVHSLTNGYIPLVEKDYEELTHEFSLVYLSEQGMPRYYWRGYEDGVTSIFFAQTPDKDYAMTISYSYTPEILDAADNTDTVVPSFYVDDIIRFCVMRAHERNKDFRASEKAEQQYTQSLYDRIDKSRQLDDSFLTIAADEYDFL